MRTTNSGFLGVKRVERLAQYFRREFRYDFVQWSATNDEPSARAFVWVVDHWPHPVGFGACCFRWREWTDAPHGWALQWIWLHPYERGKGHLTRVWPYFRETFGDFHVERPLSSAMRAFLERHQRIESEQESAA